MVTRATFEDLSLPHQDGTFFLRPGAILGAFLIDCKASLSDSKSIWDKSSRSVLEAGLAAECTTDEMVGHELERASGLMMENVVRINQASVELSTLNTRRATVVPARGALSAIEGEGDDEEDEGIFKVVVSRARRASHVITGDLTKFARSLGGGIGSEKSAETPDDMASSAFGRNPMGGFQSQAAKKKGTRFSDEIELSATGSCSPEDTNDGPRIEFTAPSGGTDIGTEQKHSDGFGNNPLRISQVPRDSAFSEAGRDSTFSEVGRDTCTSFTEL
jgi:hypothetical protein